MMALGWADPWHGTGSTQRSMARHIIVRIGLATFFMEKHSKTRHGMAKHAKISEDFLGSKSRGLGPA